MVVDEQLLSAAMAGGVGLTPQHPDPAGALTLACVFFEHVAHYLHHRRLFFNERLQCFGNSAAQLLLSGLHPMPQMNRGRAGGACRQVLLLRSGHCAGAARDGFASREVRLQLGPAFNSPVTLRKVGDQGKSIPHAARMQVQ